MHLMFSVDGLRAHPLLLQKSIQCMAVSWFVSTLQRTSLLPLHVGSYEEGCHNISDQFGKYLSAIAGLFIRCQLKIDCLIQ